MGTYEVYRIALMGFFRWLYARLIYTTENKTAGYGEYSKTQEKIYKNTLILCKLPHNVSCHLQQQATTSSNAANVESHLQQFKTKSST
jgi:hypothetical protein